MVATVISQNGWTASSDPSAIGVKTFSVNGVVFPNGVKGGDVEVVFRYLAEEYHRTVEPLHAGWCWGYFYKPIEGSTTLSNHASGTALDFNAPDHGMGSRGTFDNRQVTRIRAILAYLEGVIRWGGDYVGRADEMHFEINANASEVALAKVAAKIRGGNMSLTTADGVLVSRAVHNQELFNDGITIGAAIRDTRVEVMELRKQVAALSAKLNATTPAGNPDLEAIKKALRDVLGSLNDPA